MADDGEHSLFSASGASGWMVCHGKILMEEGRRKSSSYADEGTAAHDLAARVLQKRLAGGNVTAQAYIGEVIKVERAEGSRSFTVDSEMAENVDSYVDSFMLYANSSRAVRMVEQRVHYHTWLGVPRGEAFGTSDGVAIVYDAPPIYDDEGDLLFPGGDELQVHDLKYGKGVRVDAEGNAQLRLYALGALHEFEEFADFARVRMVIHQPRKEHTDEEVLTVEDLKAWAQAPAAAADIVSDLNAYVKGAKLAEAQLHRYLADNRHLKPDEKACRFCDAKAICPALKAEVRDAVSGGRATRDDFADLTVDPPAEVQDYGGNYLSHAASKLGLVKQWLAAVEEELGRRVRRGEKVDGFKLVAGSKGNRAWKEQGLVELAAKQLPAEVAGLLYSRKLISPTQAEKALKKGHPAVWATLQAHVHRPDGAPCVVPSSDPRPVYTPASADDFEDLTEQPTALGARPGTSSHPFR